jgi:hypothetical protein
MCTRFVSALRCGRQTFDSATFSSVILGVVEESLTSAGSVFMTMTPVIRIYDKSIAKVGETNECTGGFKEW